MKDMKITLGNEGIVDLLSGKFNIPGLTHGGETDIISNNDGTWTFIYNEEPCFFDKALKICRKVGKFDSGNWQKLRMIKEIRNINNNENFGLKDAKELVESEIIPALEREEIEEKKRLDREEKNKHNTLVEALRED